MRLVSLVIFARDYFSLYSRVETFVKIRTAKHAVWYEPRIAHEITNYRLAILTIPGPKQRDGEYGPQLKIFITTNSTYTGVVGKLTTCYIPSSIPTNTIAIQ